MDQLSAIKIAYYYTPVLFAGNFAYIGRLQAAQEECPAGAHPVE